jgi:hypothetical protein
MLSEYMEHDHPERNHQGKGHILLVLPPSPEGKAQGPIQCRARLGGLLKYDVRSAA